MAKEKNSIPTRIPRSMFDELDRALTKRFENKLISRKDFKMIEGMRLVGRMPEWKLALEKLKKVPKKENIKW